MPDGGQAATVVVPGESKPDIEESTCVSTSIARVATFFRAQYGYHRRKRHSCCSCLLQLQQDMDPFARLLALTFESPLFESRDLVNYLD